MALYSNSPNTGYVSDLDIREYAIGGKLLMAKLSVNEDDIQRMGKKFIKERMAVQLAMAMLENKMIEFTSIRNHIDLSTNIIARCYLAPDDQVKIIRELKDARF